MSMTASRSVFAALALALAATLTAAPAQAVVYSGHWDPQYGPPLPSLGWSATALIDIPDACLALSDGSYPVSGACAGVGFESAEVSFYNALDPARTPLETFDLTSVATVNIVSVSTTSGRLSGIGTDFFANFIPGAYGPASSIDGGGRYSFSFILLGDSDAQLYYVNPVDATPGCADGFANYTACGRSLNSASGAFAPVPEPGSYALMTAGLGALGLLAARRRIRPSPLSSTRPAHPAA